ncbi:MAG: hypothetical protein IJ438_06850 [Clostridia bacterium]|nr:hypothetical protein [Clostridia bacterium]
MRDVRHPLFTLLHAGLLALHCLWSLAVLSLVEICDYEQGTYRLLHEIEYFIPCLIHVSAHALMGLHALKKGVTREYHLRAAVELVLCLPQLSLLLWMLKYSGAFILLCGLIGLICPLAPLTHLLLPLRLR